MDFSKLQGLAERSERLGADFGQLITGHPLFFGTAFLFLLMTWSHFKGTFGPHIGALSKEKPVAVRGLAYLVVLPSRLAASLFSSAVALLVVALLVGFVYALWRMSHY